MKNKALLFALRDWTSVMRSTAALVLVVFSWVMFSPAVYAFYSHGVEESQSKDTFTPLTESLMDSVVELQSSIHEQHEYLVGSSKNVPENTVNDFYRGVASLQKSILEQENNVRENWPNPEQVYPEFSGYSDLLKNKLTSLEDERKQKFQKQMARVQYAINRVTSAKHKSKEETAKVLESSLATLQKVGSNKVTHSWDNEQLPFGTLPSAAREPSSSPEELMKNLKIEVSEEQAQLTSHETKSMAKGMMRSFSVLNQPVANTAENNAENLAEDIEIQFSDEIKAKVQELNYDPVQIYNWVYNNIKFIPSYGSLQGASQAFDLKAGNATDTSSILISMLRYAGVEARYKIGTVELDVDKARNWVGGVDYADSVQVLLGQGGIPNALMIYEGETKGIKLEHTWVEAYINDTWVSLDPSFKQYEFKEGVDLQNAVPFDGSDLASQIEGSMTSNEEEGWVQGIDQSAIEQAMVGYQQSLETFINENHADATVADILGGQAIIQTVDTNLPSSLPYQQVVTDTSLSKLPESMRHKFKYELKYTSLKLEDYTANLAGKALAVSFKPATEADEQILLDYLPENIESEADIPSSLPYGLFNVIAEFTVDEQVVSISGSVPLGYEMKNELGFYSPRFGWETTSNPIIAADFQAVAMDLQGVSQSQLSELQERLKATHDKIEQASPDIANNIESESVEMLSKLSKHELMGDLLQLGAVGYMGMTNYHAAILAKSSEVIYFREPSYGTFSSSSHLDYFFMQPKNVYFGAAVMDMDRMANSAECRSNCWGDWSDFNQKSGAMMSALEHLIPEKIFSSNGSPKEAVSAVKAISIANSMGQKTYTLNTKNYSSVSQYIHFHSSEMRTEINSAIYSGKTVILHDSPIDYQGFSGMGYIILDPETGAGAYKISSGANGGSLSDAFNTLAVTLLGLVDGFLAHIGKLGDIWFSEGLKHAKNLLRASLLAGILALFATAASILSSGTLGWNELGKASVALFAFAATTYIIGLIAAVALAPILAGVLGAIVAGSIAMLTTAFANRYF